MTLVEFQQSTREISMKPYTTEAHLSVVVYDKFDSKHGCARKKSRKKSGLHALLQSIKSSRRRYDKQRLRVVDIDEL